jgi:hypothetical protein
MALIRFMEFILITLDLAYLGAINPLNKYLIVILMSAIVYSLIAIASYSFTISMLIVFTLVLAIGVADTALLVLVVTTQLIMPSIGLYTVCFINVILDALVLIIILELIRR